MPTTNKNLNQPAYNSGTWDVPLNNNFGYIDSAFGGTATISNTSAYTLATAEYQSMRLFFNGTLSNNVTISFPAGVGGFWIVTNGTSDASSAVIRYLTISSLGGGTSITPPRGSTVFIYSDGTNVGYAMPFTQPGTIISYGGTSAPTGFILCDGAAVSRSTYSALFQAISTAWGVGDGTTTFNVPDLRGAFVRGSGAGLNPSPRTVGTYEADAYLNHSHAITDPEHTHTMSFAQSGDDKAYPLGSGLLYNTGTRTTNSSATGITVNASTTGSTETRPKNYATLFCIKT